MPLKIPNVEFKKPITNPTIDAPTSPIMLQFYKNDDYFSNLESFVQFVKAVENLVRTSPLYKRYIGYLKNDLGLNFCQVLSNIKTEEDDITEIEMHHGPILTLFDIVSIVIDSMLYKKDKITTFKVADIVLAEHYAHNIQVVMLSKTVHQKVHDNDIFISMKQSFGDITTFLKKYKNGLNEEQIYKINNYITLSEKYDSFDKGVLALRDVVKSWNPEGFQRSSEGEFNEYF